VKRGLALTAAALALAGCTLEPHYVRPTPAVPGSWPTGPAYAGATSAEAAPLPSLTYRDVFKDPHLQAIIERALANSQNLRTAMANVEIAHAEYVVQRSDLLPHINAGLTASQSQSRLGSVTASGEPTRETTRTYTGTLGFSAFELDLFGRLRSLSHAAQDRYFATEAGARAARLTLVGEVADAYLTYATDKSLLAIAEDTVASAQRTVDLTQAKLTGGVSPRTDLTQAQTLLDQARSDRARLITQVAQDHNTLELLVGAPVADADLPASIESVDGLLAEAPAGLDSRILLRRPDVVEAEYGLRAANAQIGAARAAFFPTIDLTALTGAASPALSSLFSGANRTWSLVGGVTQPIFAGGANVGGLEGARGQRDLAVAEYQQAIQTAFRQVADALARRGTIRDQLAADTDLFNAAQTSYTLSEARYREGIDPYLNTLVTQRTLYSARQGLAETRLAAASNLVALYQSLGGDEVIDSLPPPKVDTKKASR
jgi:multidrug efflux system outer membrane protein